MYGKSVLEAISLAPYMFVASQAPLVENTVGIKSMNTARAELPTHHDLGPYHKM